MSENADGASFGAETGRPIRQVLLRLVVLSSLPILLCTIALVVNLALMERAAGDEALLEHARVLTVAIERDLKASTAVLATLQASPLLDDKDLAAFHGYAARVLESWPGTRVALVAPDGTALLTTARPFGSVLPNVLAPVVVTPNAEQQMEQASNVQAWRQFFDRPATQYSNLFASAVTGESTVSIRYPVVRDGAIKYALVQAFPATLVQQNLRSLNPNPSWITSIVDGNGVIIARSLSGEQLVGSIVSSTLRQAIASGRSTVGKGVTRDGQPVRHAVVRSELTGWWLAVAEPASLVSARVVPPVVLWGAGIIASLLLGFALARRTWRQLSEPLRDISSNALAFERGEPLRWPSSNIREIRHCSYAWTLAIQNEEKRRDERSKRIVAETRRQELEDANVEKDRLLAALSHELRNPLGAITNSVGVLTRLAPGDSRASAMIDIIKRQAGHLTRLVDDLLDLAGARFGKMRLNLAALNVYDLALVTIKLYDQQAHTMARIKLEGSAAWIQGDAARIDQVLRNLLDNAIKFTDPAGTIVVSVRSAHNETTVAVTDSGIGLASGSEDEIFGAFVQNDQSIDRPQGGLGLGLALVRQIVQLHGGSVKATSPGEGLGTCITVTLPAVLPTIVSQP